MTDAEAPTVAGIRAELQQLADPVRATHSLRFFKTGPGQYGEGDKFLGLVTRTDLLSYLRLHMPKESVPPAREYL